MHDIIPKEVKKRTFLGLLLAILLFFMFLAVYLLWFARNPLIHVSRNVILVVTLAALCGVLLFLCGLAMASLSIIQNRPLRGLGWLTGKMFFLFYPLVVSFGRLLHIAQERIQFSFIAVNNRLVATQLLKMTAKDVLLLLPHCLQYDRCEYKITRDPGNCRRCGRCQVPDILDLAAAKGVELEIVSGGTLARRAVIRHRPRAVVAVACERDLSSGILDSFPLPVFGVVNERPQGPCVNTRVDLALLEKTLDSLLWGVSGGDNRAYSAANRKTNPAKK